MLLLLLLLAGCEKATYYRHLTMGQMRMLYARQPIDALIASPHTEAGLKRKLDLVLSIREFAKNELHLPVENQFVYYVDHGRPVSVWNVYAAPEFSMSPKKWCFPVAGCTIYKGFFDEKKASEYAAQLEASGYDVHVGGAGGYSTLGWFSDPIYRNILERSDEQIAAYMFHELAHKLLYVKGDTAFNEGFAVAVEQEGVRRWLAKRNESDLFINFLRSSHRQIDFSLLVKNTRSELTAVYRKQGLTPDEAKYEKNRVFVNLYHNYQNLQSTWNGYTGFDRWFDTPVNNARLIPFGAYYDHVPAFSSMIRAAGGDLEVFYDMAKHLAEKPREERMKVWPGLQYPIGPVFDGAGTNFSIFSEIAHRVQLCLFDDRGKKRVSRCRKLPDSAGMHICRKSNRASDTDTASMDHGNRKTATGAILQNFLLDPYAKPSMDR
jgi:predicted aminopeptidase